LDNDFHLSGGANNTVYSALLQPDGKILVAGSFTLLNGESRNHIGRLNSDGTLDDDFNPNVNGSVYALALQADGKILLGGVFTEVGDAAAECKRICRLNPDGALDASFVVPGGANLSVRSIVPQADGKIMVAGAFTQIGEMDIMHIARLNSDGALDAGYMPPDGANGTVHGLVLQSDGKAVLGGAFLQLTGQNRNRIGRLTTDASALQSLAVSASLTEIVWTRSGGGPDFSAVVFDQSPDNAAWSVLGDGARTTNGWRIAGVDLPLNTNVYIRARGFYRCGYFNNSVSVCESVRLVYLAPPPVARTIADPSIVDSAGRWYVWFSGSNYERGEPFDFDVPGTPVVGDFDNDGMADPAGVVSSLWYIWFSSLEYQMDGPYNFGVSGQPVAGDFDGDGSADPAIVVGPLWYIWFSSLKYQLGDGPFDFGVSGLPVAGDFDNDGSADPAVAVGPWWYIWFSSLGYQLGGGPFNFGVSGTPVAGDFDGDGSADPAVVSANGGLWYIYFSSAGYQLAGGPWNFGLTGTPLAAEFDGQ
jgi:uncharacterized delta-60 repeat protein